MKVVWPAVAVNLNLFDVPFTVDPAAAQPEDLYTSNSFWVVEKNKSPTFSDVVGFEVPTL